MRICIVRLPIMKFPDPLIRGKLIKRYKRFLTDVELANGEVVIAHCANPGSMLSVNDPGSEVWLSPARNPDRKLRYTWELIRVGDTLVGINTSLPNSIVEAAVNAGTIPELAGYASAAALLCRSQERHHAARPRIKGSCRVSRCCHDARRQAFG
jgi:sugar fermentation stimulation protein